MKKFKKVLLSSTALLLIFCFQNCSNSGFQTLASDNLSNLTSERSPGSPGPYGRVEGDTDLFVNFQKVMESHCVQCHGAADSPFNGITSFANLKTQEDWINSSSVLIVPGAPQDSPIFNRLAFAKGRVANSNTNMPFPLGGVAPTMTQNDADIIENYILSINSQRDVLATCEQNYNSGQVELRRLNKRELRNSMKDIFGIENAFRDLPESAAGQFSNLGRFQSMDETVFDFYRRSTEWIAGRVTSFFTTPIESCGRNISCLEGILDPIAELLYRKRITTSDKATYVKAIENAFNHPQHFFDEKEGFQAAIQAMLLNPQFLYVVRTGKGDGEKPFGAFELATRLSLTLFSSIPDRELWEKARTGEILTKYDQVIDKLMSSDRFHTRFVDSFSEGWLGLSRIDGVSPVTEHYGMNAEEFRPVATSMKEAIRLSLTYNLKQGQPVENLIVNRHRYLNREIASHLGISGSFGDSFQRVELPASSPYSNTGLLTSAPVVATSLPDRESIIFRGIEVMGAFTCQTPPPPPDNVVAEIEPSLFPEGTSQRDMLEAHSRDQACASCHQTFDPYGFGLNMFDGLGRFRTKDQFGNEVDATGSVNGSSFTDHKGLAKILVADKKFHKCLTQTLIAYTIGKDVDPKSQKADLCTIERVTKQSTDNGNGDLKSSLREILTNRYFTHWLDQ